ncbi:phosphopantetheinyl transferase [Duganella sp. 3397]|uniref:4'-phosphopantetheinyl transferase family protein n=1 Tax=Duganella sp. 3397 TaxID=2817732 RepID=UPI00285984D9|nr:4'-phosphopantetheinyl transferase superfamily protein [Duganella sp. 3397]MDR7049491.1 phosphopantetheinyl transferase [Duganella sp. 3397]
MQKLAVHVWPGPAPTIADGVFVIGLPTGEQREEARQQLRQAVAEALGAVLDVPPREIEIEASPGAAPVVLLPDGQRLHCSFAHDGGMSLAAVCFSGPVGVDLMLSEEVAGWEAVARDYLGPEATARIAATARAERAAVFARAWTAREAHLKWLGVGLDEWPAHSQSSGTTVTLDLPERLVGTLVYMDGAA